MPRPRAIGLLLLAFVFGPASAAGSDAFRLAVIPDTQNYIDFRRQTAEGFEFDAADLFIAQMRYVATNAIGNGGDIAFVAAVGDVWQHQTRRIDPLHHNSAEQLWHKLLRRQDQVFLVLSGHHHGQGFRVDANEIGIPVYQILADYRSRGRVAFDFGRSGQVGIGDGWLRLMRFDFGAAPATASIRTYSTHYEKFSSQTPEYADWYKAGEQPHMSDAEFHAADEFVIRLDGFAQRFGEPRS